MKSSEAITNYLTLLFQNVAWANIGDVSGLLPSGAAGSFYLSLHTGYPGTGSDQTVNEAAYGSYARVAVARTAGNWTVATPQVSNANTINFASCTSGSESENHWGLGTDASGVGHLLYSGPLTDKILSFVAETTNNITVPGSSFLVNDRVSFYPGVPDDTFPPDLTAGTLYYVKTVSGDVITVSTTSGGSVVAINTAGSGACAKIAAIAMSPGATPSINAGGLVILER